MINAQLHRCARDRYDLTNSERWLCGHVPAHVELWGGDDSLDDVPIIWVVQNYGQRADQIPDDDDDGASVGRPSPNSIDLGLFELGWAISHARTA